MPAAWNRTRAFAWSARAEAGASWAVLLALLGATLAGAVSFDRGSWPGLLGDEATYLMQAQSLAWDLDLTYSPADYQRFVRQWHQPPEGLILQRGAPGRPSTFGKPVFYSAAIAPFLRLAPRRGPAIANALFLALAALFAARVLARRLGAAAPLWVAAWVFASVAFAYVFWAHADLFEMCLSAVALALAFGGETAGGEGAQARDQAEGQPRDQAEGQPRDQAEGQPRDQPPPEPRRRFLLRWAGAGALLAIVIASRPLYAPLLLPAALAVPRGRRKSGLLALAAGTLLVLAAAVLFALALRGTWTSYAGERRGFYSYTGFPGAGLPADDWDAAGAPSASTWIEPATLRIQVDPKLWAWDALYNLVGRDVGLLPYFLPLLLGFLLWPRDGARWALPVAAAAVLAAFILLRPFNFYGGGGAIADRYFLPVYPLFWFLPRGPMRPARARLGAILSSILTPALAPILAAALAAPFLWPLWSAPRAFPLDANGVWRYVSPAARRLLPYETTLSHLKPAGREDLVHHGLWIKLLDRGIEPSADGSVLNLRRGQDAELLVGNATPLAALRLTLHGDPAGLAVAGAAARPPARDAEGATVLDLALGAPRARHAMWWTADPFCLYQLRLRLLASPAGETVPFTLAGLPER